MDYINKIKDHIDFHFKKRKYNKYNTIIHRDCSPLKLYVIWVIDGKSEPSNNITILFEFVDIITIEGETRGNVAEDALYEVLKDLDRKLETIHKNTTGEEYPIDFNSKIIEQLEKKHGYDFSDR